MDCPHLAPTGRLRGPVAILMERRCVVELQVVALQFQASAVGPDSLAVAVSRRVFLDAKPGIREAVPGCAIYSCAIIKNKGTKSQNGTVRGLVAR